MSIKSKNKLWLYLVSSAIQGGIKDIIPIKDVEFKESLNKIKNSQNENSKKNFFSKMYSNFKDLMPLVFDLEGEFLTVRNMGKKTVLNDMFPYLDPVGIDFVLGLNLKRDYWENFWEGIKLELGTTYMIKAVDKITDKIGNIIKHGDIYRKIDKSNYYFKSLIISKKNKDIFEKMFYILKIPFRQKLIYMLGTPGTGKTTMVLDQLLRNGYTVYYLNGNNILLSDQETDSIIQILDRLKQEILAASPEEQKKIVLVLDECEVAFRDTKKLKKLLDNMRGAKNRDTVTGYITENTILKEIALTAFMLYMLSLHNFAVVCIANTTEISPYMQRRITYLVDTTLSIEEYFDLWKAFIHGYKIYFKEGDVEDLIYEISKFSMKNKTSIRTIKQFASFFRNKEISIAQLFDYCNRIEE